MKSHVRALTRAIDIVGSQSKLAAALRKFMNRQSVSQQTISYWLRNEVLLDPEWWPAIEHVTGGKVTRMDLRPDVHDSHPDLNPFHTVPQIEEGRG